MNTSGRFMKPIDIHLVSWNRPKITEMTIRTIARNTKSANYRLVVLDNGSGDGQQKILQDLQDNGYIDELILWDRNYGLEKARDHMFRHSTHSEYFVCADNDCLPQPIESSGDWLEKLIDLMNRYEDYAAISCRTQVMIGTGNIFEDETKELTDFPHPGGSLRIMKTEAVKEAGGWEGKPGRGAEERWICGQLREFGYKTAFATYIKCLHLFGLQDTDRWGYEGHLKPEDTGHSDISHPALDNGDDLAEVAKYAGKELADVYGSYKG